MSNIVEKFILDNRGKEITKQEGNFSLFVWGSSPFGCYSPYTDRYYKQDFGSVVFLIKGNFGAGFFSLENYKKPTREIFEKIIENKSGKDLVELKDFNKFQKETASLYEELDPRNLSKIKTYILVEKIKKGFSLLFWIQAVTLFSEALDESMVKEFYNRLGGEPEDFEEFFKVSSLLTFKSFSSRNDEALSRFESASTYNIQWILANYSVTPSIEDAEIKIKEIIKERGGLKVINDEKDKLEEQIKFDKEKVEKFSLSLSGDIKKLFDFNQLCMYLRDIRKDDYLKNITLLSNCLRELFIRLGLDQKDVIYAFYPDFDSDIYKNNSYKDIIEKRKKGFIVYYNKDGIQSEYGEGDTFLKDLYVAMDKSFSSHEQNIIKGNIGCKGKAQAKVSVILDQKDFSKFKQGEILVTSMTRPEFVPLMKQASAVITDEGGITCHAAIISRELGIPCIIGTKNATRVLRDGDMVEVDANKGIVRIIK